MDTPRDDATEIYFISNQSTDLKNDISAEVAFRVTGKQPELWDPVTGTTRDLHQWREEDGCTSLSMRFAPRQSWFVVFREQAKPGHNTAGEKNFPELKQVAEITGPWSVQFDPERVLSDPQPYR